MDCSFEREGFGMHDMFFYSFGISYVDIITQLLSFPKFALVTPWVWEVVCIYDFQTVRTLNYNIATPKKNWGKY